MKQVPDSQRVIEVEGDGTPSRCVRHEGGPGADKECGKADLRPHPDRLALACLARPKDSANDPNRWNHHESQEQKHVQHATIADLFGHTLLSSVRMCRPYEIISAKTKLIWRVA